MIISATQAGPSGGVGTAARMGTAGSCPPNTAKALKVAVPTCALEPTASAQEPRITLGAYRIASRVKLS
ncbi:Uncharacterised protein [Mycobacteroides abscessus subsp. abscessus]|nr:Uncharacterised protein [Mycobacteroides abscessus subsp. abscessus]SIN51888.1 Uncharacterised protein [Mycobacteroides abscessus subsp. abscessus]